jgi:hypothetical protein
VSCLPLLFGFSGLSGSLVGSDPANKIDQTKQTNEINPLISGRIAYAEVDDMSDMTYDPVRQGIVV